ncbi:MAG: hypothetical protein Q7R64_03890 [bacterium]|nr:hypothetical protein [bacterium]
MVYPSGKRPSLEITTPQGMFHLVTVEGEVISTFENGKLVFILFYGKPPIGRSEVFVWPPTAVQESGHVITELQVYGT